MNDECEKGFDYYDLHQKQKDWEQKKQKTKGDYFCLISVICMGLSLVSTEVILMGISRISEGAFAFAGLLSIAITITAYVLMVYVRVRYPQNKFGKVLMWVYIGLAIVAVVYAVGFAVFMYLFIKWLEVSCSKIPG